MEIGFLKINEYMEIVCFFIVLIALTPLLGNIFARMLSGDTVPMLSLLKPVEKACFKMSGINPRHEMHWREYAFCVVLFNIFGLIVVLLLQIFQHKLPLNPQHLGPVSAFLALNTAVSFITNTNWQAYSGESTLSYFVQTIGLTVQNFVSASTGIAVMVALARGIERRKSNSIGNFWVDLVRSTLYILLPLSLILAVLLIGQGVIQNFSSYVTTKTIEGYNQVLPMGPAASQIAIKQLGTNGGGFFGVNSAHPFENPTPFSNFLQCLAILLIPSALVYSFGVLIKSKRHGYTLLAIMFLLFSISLGLSLWQEHQPNNALHGLPFLEGKENRLGITSSVLWGMATTSASNGSVNAMHDSFSPIAGGVAMFNMLLGEVVFGGVGSGVYGIVLFAILTVFIAGLMVGRTPEYLGKKIEARDVGLAVVGVLLPCATVLIFSSLSLVTKQGISALGNVGPHGLSEILYAFASTSNNNGSAFAGLNVTSTYYLLLTSIAMIVGRYGVIIPILALSGSLATKKVTPPSAGTFPTYGVMFAVLLVGVILIVGVLTFFPALMLGPFIEHILMASGHLF
jgi:K+-transporting ATPase ATPase A chain